MGHKARPAKTGASKFITAAIHRLLAGNPDLADRWVAAQSNRALRGDLAAISFLTDRVEGRVPYKHGGDDEGEPITMIVTGVPRAGRD